VAPETYRWVEPDLFERIIDWTVSGADEPRRGAVSTPPAQHAGG
jgi:hypothetical protein